MSDNGLAPNKRRAIIWTHDNLVSWRIYAICKYTLSSTSRARLVGNIRYPSEIHLKLKFREISFVYKIRFSAKFKNYWIWANEILFKMNYPILHCSVQNLKTIGYGQTRFLFKMNYPILHEIPYITQHPWTQHSYSELHYSDVTISMMASQITSLTIVYSTVHLGADQRKHQSSPAPAFVRGIHRWPVNSPHKGPVTRKMFPFDDAIMEMCYFQWQCRQVPLVLVMALCRQSTSIVNIDREKWLVLLSLA